MFKIKVYMDVIKTNYYLVENTDWILCKHTVLHSRFEHKLIRFFEYIDVFIMFTHNVTRSECVQ